jgi:ubiquinone/menaquinone biosynthesis C-methylase UbiE
MDSANEISRRYDEVCATYEREEADVARRLYWLAYEHLTWSAVEAELPQDRALRVLDAGGGGGKYGVLLAERGHEVTVLDLSAGMLEQARERLASRGLAGRASFREGNIVDLPFAEASFDLVLCEGDPVSYCLDAYPRAVAELVRVVKRGGAVILGVDNRQEYFLGAVHSGDRALALRILETGRATCPYGLPVHTFTVAELSRAVSAAGADVVEIIGKPVLFFEVLAAMKAARGPAFDPWEARQEILSLQSRLCREGYATSGGHLQVVARRRQG